MSRPTRTAVTLTTDDAELLAHAWWQESDPNTSWEDLEEDVRAGYVDGACDWIIRAAKLRGSGTRDVELVPTQHQPRVEIVVYRDPDYTNEVVVFLDGQEVEAEVSDIDPGVGYGLSIWRGATESAVVEASPAAAAQIREWYAEAEASPFIVEDDKLPVHQPFPAWEEVAEPYAQAEERERFVVTLVVGYDPSTAPGVTTALAAAQAALELTREEGSSGQMDRFEQREFEDAGDPS